MSKRVAIVFDPEFGGRLEMLIMRLPVWIVESETNRPAVSEAWQRAVEWPQISVTFFRPSDNLKHVLSQVGHPQRVEVIGLPLTEDLRAALQVAGLPTVRQTAHGFRATAGTTPETH